MSNSGMGPAVVNLPPHLKSMFEPRAPLLYRPAIVKRKMPPYHGIGAFVHEVYLVLCECILSCE